MFLRQKAADLTPDRIRIATAQYYIRPVQSFDAFVDQVTGIVATAGDYDSKLLVLPEYFTIQLLTLGDITRPVTEQVRNLARRVPQFIGLMSALAKKHGLYIVAGSIPNLDENDEQKVHNDSFVFGPSGEHVVQGKMHMTRWESEEWLVSPRRLFHVIETDFGKIAVTICYDVEFPELARAAAHAGCYLLVCPSCTDDRQGYLRVRYCAQARCVENTMYVVHACTVGSLPMVPAVSMNYGSASILTPSDFPFARDGIAAQGNVNQEQLVIADIGLDTIRKARENGTVLPLRDSLTTAEVTRRLEQVTL
jgi:predicted amidohydrolase